MSLLNYNDLTKDTVKFIQILHKKYNNLTFTGPNVPLMGEDSSRPNVYIDQIYGEQIPDKAPSTNTETVKKYTSYNLTSKVDTVYIDTSANSFKNIIYNPKKGYNFKIEVQLSSNSNSSWRTVTNSTVWVIDAEKGVLIFFPYNKDTEYTTKNVKIRVSFWSYTGKRLSDIIGNGGAIGQTGAKGDTGLPGAQGLPGAKGDTGLTGLTGAKGDTGLTGAKGDTGLTGARGTKGNTGEKGADGLSINVIGTLEQGKDIANINTTNLNDQDSYISADSKTLYVWSGSNKEWIEIQNANLLKGDKGDKGDTGDTGDTGADGLSIKVQGTLTPGQLISDIDTMNLNDQDAYLSADSKTLYVWSVLNQNWIEIQNANLLKGDTGARGAIGATGEIGPIGATGETGRTGQTGLTGEKGADGLSINVIGTLKQGQDIASIDTTNLNDQDAYLSADSETLYVRNVLNKEWIEIKKANLLKGDKGDTGADGLSITTIGTLASGQSITDIKITQNLKNGDAYISANSEILYVWNEIKREWIEIKNAKLLKGEKGDSSKIIDINAGEGIDIKIDNGIYTIINKSVKEQDLSISLGYNAGEINQQISCIAIGTYAGNTNQNNYALAIGTGAGEKNQGTSAISLGTCAGNKKQGEHSIAIGYNAGEENQFDDSISIGYSAGRINQGKQSIAIGYKAGERNQVNNTIIINATNDPLNCSDYEAGCYIKPIAREPKNYKNKLNQLYYDVNTGQLLYKDNKCIEDQIEHAYKRIQEQQKQYQQRQEQYQQRQQQYQQEQEKRKFKPCVLSHTELSGISGGTSEAETWNPIKINYFNNTIVNGTDTETGIEQANGMRLDREDGIGLVDGRDIGTGTGTGNDTDTGTVTDNGIQLKNNEIIFINEGTYYITFSSSTYNSDDNVARFFGINNTKMINGINIYGSGFSTGAGILKIEKLEKFRLEHWTKVGISDNGLGKPLSIDGHLETYAQITINKI